MATKHTNEVKEAAAPLIGTPYEYLYAEWPTPTSGRFVFQHTVAISETEALVVIADALARIKAGTAEWSDGSAFVAQVRPPTEPTG